MSYAFQPVDQNRRLMGLGVVGLLHVFLLWAIISGTAQKGLAILKKPMEAVVIQEVFIPPPPPPPPPPKEVKPPEPLAPKVEAAPPPMQPTPTPVAIPQAVAPAPIEKPPEVVREAPPAPVAAPAPVARAPEPAKPGPASLEGEYIAKVRVMLNSTKRYPTGRQASQQRPQGTVKVWFTLSRSGALVDSGILESSNSNMLDDAALGTVRRGVYPPFPENTWADQPQHKFSADIAFAPPSSE